MEGYTISEDKTIYYFESPNPNILVREPTQVRISPVKFSNLQITNSVSRMRSIQWMIDFFFIGHIALSLKYNLLRIAAKQFQLRPRKQTQADAISRGVRNIIKHREVTLRLRALLCSYQKQVMNRVEPRVLTERINNCDTGNNRNKPRLTF